MKKKELINLVESLNLPKDEYYILSSGSLILYNLREEANDLDICVSKELFEIIKEKYNIDLKSKNNCGFYKLNSLIDVVVNDKKEFNRTFKDDYPVETLENILQYKIKRNAPKDREDIIKIQSYLKNIK